MVDLLKMSENRDSSSLGRSITSWVYRSKRSGSFIAYFIGLLGAAVIFIMIYARHLVPLLSRIPDGFLYIFIFLIGPLLKALKLKGGDQQYTLYENGFTIAAAGKGGATGETKVGFWVAFTECTYSSNAVTLSSSALFKGKTRLMVSSNVSAIYSVCRERISIAQAQKLYTSNPAPSTPNTAEQRKLKSFEKQTQWKRSLPADRKRAWRG